MLSFILFVVTTLAAFERKSRWKCDKCYSVSLSLLQSISTTCSYFNQWQEKSPVDAGSLQLNLFGFGARFQPLFRMFAPHFQEDKYFLPGRKMDR